MHSTPVGKSKLGYLCIIYHNLAHGQSKSKSKDQTADNSIEKNRVIFGN